MKRNIESFRSQKWLLRNSLNNPSCVSYVHDLCEIQFGLTNFDIKPFNNGENSLWLQSGLNFYIVTIDTQEVCLMVLERNTDGQNKDKYHLLPTRFTGDSCWFRCLNWIKNKNIL